MSGERSTCPDCETELQPVKITDATDRAFGEGTYRVELTYAAHEAQAPLGGFLGGIPPLGIVEGRICPKCGRIILYGKPF